MTEHDDAIPELVIYTLEVAEPDDRDWVRAHWREVKSS